MLKRNRKVEENLSRRRKTTQNKDGGKSKGVPQKTGTPTDTWKHERKFDCDSIHKIVSLEELLVEFLLEIKFL